MKLTLKSGQYRDRTILIELFDFAVSLYKQGAVDEALGPRMRAQFEWQAAEGADLALQIFHQRNYHEIVFRLSEDVERDRWLMLNMMTTGIEELATLADAATKPPIKAQLLQRIARAEQLREMIEDTEARA